MADILYNVLERFSITKYLLCTTTDNAGNNGTMRKELEELLNNLDINNSWSSESIKIPCLAYVIQLVVKAILGAVGLRGVMNRGGCASSRSSGSPLYWVI
jgi:hypothetical protein